jgi:hypothetical protein
MIAEQTTMSLAGTGCPDGLRNAERLGNMKIEYDRFVTLYAELCNFFWYHSHPDWPKDELLHTSSECRRWASEVFKLLGIEDASPESHYG